MGQEEATSQVEKSTTVDGGIKKGSCITDEKKKPGPTPIHAQNCETIGGGETRKKRGGVRSSLRITVRRGRGKSLAKTH